MISVASVLNAERSYQMSHFKAKMHKIRFLTFLLVYLLTDMSFCLLCLSFDNFVCEVEFDIITYDVRHADRVS